jgi:hypothetical protein
MLAAWLPAFHFGPRDDVVGVVNSRNVHAAGPSFARQHNRPLEWVRDRRTYCQFGTDGRGLAAAFSVVATVAGESTLGGSQSWMLEGGAWAEVKLGDGHSFHEEGEEHGVDT